MASGGQVHRVLEVNFGVRLMASKRKLYTGGCKGKYRGIAIVGEGDDNDIYRESFEHTFTGSSCEGETDNGRGYFYRKN